MSDDPILDVLARVEANQAKFGTEIAALRADFLPELGSRSGAITEKVPELQASVALIRDDLAVKMGGVDAARQANDNKRVDVTQMREQMSIMWKQIKRLEEKVRSVTGEP
ncbi:MAG: hypothetical protein ABSC06_19375 [Rhodopila sp.]|jgi:hypothetical protein